ncbi:MAG: LCCL domain-containing protein [Paracoccaceae bacterium]
MPLHILPRLRLFAVPALMLAALPAAAQTNQACAAYPVGEESYSCHCSAFAAQGPVWGSGPYTADSDLCTAARHAGVIGISGGNVTAWAAPGEAAYSGTTRNGIGTQDWGAYEQSFTLTPPAALPEVAAADPVPPADDGDLCPRRMPAGEARLTCACPQGQPGGMVWGTDAYTLDSALCAAALHAGAVTGDGGRITVSRTAGQDVYAATSRNGISSKSWGPARESLTIAAAGGAGEDPAPRAPSPASGDTCPRRLGADQAALACTCPPGRPLGLVWGSGPYTVESALCAAAAHAGIVGEGGGPVAVARGGPADSFAASLRNGIASLSWGAARESLSVSAPGALAPPPKPKAATVAGAQGACPRRLPEGQAALSCTCPAGVSSGLVWGSGPYTADSDLCSAARHAGVVGAEGGQITVQRAGGQDSYAGSARNGVISRDWGIARASLTIGPVAQEPAIPPGLELVTGGASGVVCGAFPSGALTLDCTCTGQPSTGKVFGSGPYAVGSDLCRAARHAGAIGAAGGRLRVLSLTGLQGYRGSERNGVTSEDLGSAPRSVTFDTNLR